MKPNWSNYQDIYDLYVNGKKMKQIWGKSKAIKTAKSTSGGLFEQRKVELVNIQTGEIIYQIN